MEVWLINHYAGGPAHGMGYRHFYLARHLKEYGIEPVIISASFTHLYHKPVEMGGWYTLTEEDGVRRVYLRTRHYEGNGLNRFLNTRDFSRGLRRFARQQIMPRPALILGSSPHLAAAFSALHVAQNWRIPFYFEVRDLLPLSLIEAMNLSRFHPLMLRWQYLENRLIRKADRVVSILPLTEEYFTARGLPKGKMSYLPNGIEPALPKDHAVSHPILREMQRHKGRGEFTLMYTGSIGPANSLDTVLGAAGILRDEGTSHIHIYLIGGGPEKRHLHRKAENLGLANVHFIDKMPRSQLIRILEVADACYIGLKKAPAFRFGVCPNKLLEYMLAGKPIIYAINSGNHPVEDADCGIEINPEAPEELASAMLILANKTEQERAEMGQRGKEYVLRYHRYETLAAKLAEIIKVDVGAKRG